MLPGQTFHLLPELFPSVQLLQLVLLLGLELPVTLVEQLLVHLHEQFDRVIDQPVNRFVPVRFRVAVQRRKHDREYDFGVLRNQ